MKPETVTKLLGDFPETQELLAYIAAQAESLNLISDIKVENMHGHTDMAIEVLARQRAYEKLFAILEPFINAPTKRTDRAMHNEYAVEVDSPKPEK